MIDKNVANSVKPIDLATQQSIEFIESHVTLKDLSVLEVGAGNGDLAVAMMQRGAHVRAVDLFEDAVAAAKARGVDIKLADFLEYEDDPFDMIIFTRSLHHIHPVEKAVSNAARLLKPSGTLLIEELGPELMDESTVKWLDGQLNAITLTEDSGLARNSNEHSRHAGEHGAHNDQQSKHAGEQVRHSDYISKTASFEQWRKHHFDHHKISDSKTVCEALAKEFLLEPTQIVRVLYRYAIERLPENEEGYRSLLRIAEEEQDLMNKGKLRQIGYYLVGHKK